MGSFPEMYKDLGLERVGRGAFGRAVNTSNPGSGGPDFKRCFLRQGTLISLSLFTQARVVQSWVKITQG